jgi:hypothetical protein
MTPTRFNSIHFFYTITDPHTAHLWAIHSSGTFEVLPYVRGTKGTRRTFRITKIEAQAVSLGAENVYVPYFFDLESSKVLISGNGGAQTIGSSSSPIQPLGNAKSIQLDFEGLRGLDAQLEKLQNHISKINRLFDKNTKYFKYSQPSPVLIHGPSGK